MLYILYRSGFYVYKSNTLLRGGEIVTFVGNRTVGLCNDQKMPVGFCCSEAFELAQSNYTIGIGQGEFQTDLFDPGIYKHNDLLYCSSKGLISNNPIYHGNTVVGIVNHVEKDRIGFITCPIRA